MRIDAAGEIEGIAIRPALSPLVRQCRHRLNADIPDRAERVADCLGAVVQMLNRKRRPGRVDVGRQQGNPKPLELPAEQFEPVDIVNLQAHRSRQELDRVVGLEVGGLVGDQRVSRGVGLVEAVACKFRDQIEDAAGVGP